MRSCACADENNQSSSTAAGGSDDGSTTCGLLAVPMRGHQKTCTQLQCPSRACSCRYQGTWLSSCCGPGGKLSVNARIVLCAIAKSAAAAAAAAAWPDVIDRLRSNVSSAPGSMPPPLDSAHSQHQKSTPDGELVLLHLRRNSSAYVTESWRLWSIALRGTFIMAACNTQTSSRRACTPDRGTARIGTSVMKDACSRADGVAGRCASQPEVCRSLGERRQMRCSAHAHVRRSRAGRRLRDFSTRMCGARKVVEVGTLLSARMPVDVQLILCAGISHLTGMTVGFGRIDTLRCRVPGAKFVTLARREE